MTQSVGRRSRRRGDGRASLRRFGMIGRLRVTGASIRRPAEDSRAEVVRGGRLLFRTALHRHCHTRATAGSLRLGHLILGDYRILVRLRQLLLEL